MTSCESGVVLSCVVYQHDDSPGAIGMRRVSNSDDFATARRSYGPIFLAFALTATLQVEGLSRNPSFSL